MNINVRNAKIKDAPALAHIQVTSWRSAFRNIASDEYLDHMVSEEDQVNDWKEILASLEQVVVVAENGNKLLGYAWAHQEEDESVEWDAELISIHVLPEYKRQGIGRRLFITTAEQLNNKGCRSVYLWVLEENHPSRKFYEMLGGKPTGYHQIELGDRRRTAVAYAWKDIHVLEMTE
jgi:ribosomal protein S18 acetylase RimI-like enzyme